MTTEMKVVFPIKQVVFNASKLFSTQAFSTQASCFQRKQVVFNASCFHNRFRVYYRFISYYNRFHK
jgi:hypothetical protein